MTRLVLIVEPDVARAAQYAAMVEARGYTTRLCRSGEEAIFQLDREGSPPALLVLEMVLPHGDGFEVIRALRKRARQTPAIVISGSLRLRDEAARLRDELGIVDVLAKAQPMGSVARAILRALGESVSGPDNPRVATASEASEPPPASPFATIPPAAGLRPVASAPQGMRGTKEHPLMATLRASDPFPNGTGDDALQELVDRTAALFEVPTVVGFFEHGGRSLLRAHLTGLDVDPSKLAPPAAWASFRNCSIGAPIGVADACRSSLLVRNPLVLHGMVSSLLGAPLAPEGGPAAGALCLMHPTVGQLRPELLDPLSYWAQRIGEALCGERSSKPPPSASEREPTMAPGVQERFGQAKISVSHALEGVVANLASGILVTDDDGTVAVSNRNLAALFGLSAMRLIGLRRADLVALLQRNSDIPPGVAQTIAQVPAGSVRRIAFPVQRPERRTVSWSTRPLQIANVQCQLDEFIDVTHEVAQAEARERLVRIDPLTELLDRRGADEALGREAARTVRSNDPLTVTLYEVDQLAQLDPNAQEKVLRAAGWVLRQCLRGYDQAARYSQTQLLAILPSVDLGRGRIVANRFCVEIAALRLPGLPVLTVSGGAAQFDKSQQLEQMMSRALAGLLEAKAAGGNQVL